MPKDRVTQSHQGYGFVEFLAEDDADYAIKIMNMIKLYGKPIRVNKVIEFNTQYFTCMHIENMYYFSVFYWLFFSLLKLQASAHQKNLDVGANVFIGNLDSEVDEKLLYDTFSAFGVILQTPKVLIIYINFFLCSYFNYLIYVIIYKRIIIILWYSDRSNCSNFDLNPKVFGLVHDLSSL